MDIQTWEIYSFIIIPDLKSSYLILREIEKKALVKNENHDSRRLEFHIIKYSTKMGFL